VNKFTIGGVVLHSTYELPGVRSATTAPQESLTARAVEVLSADERVLAVYLVGGFAIGVGDAWSDIDLQCVIADDATDAFVTGWREVVARITPAVYVQPFAALVANRPTTGPIGGMVITPEWLHLDIVFNPESTVDPMTVEGMVPLFDRVGMLPGGPVPRPDRQGEPFFPEAAVRYFLYMLGNMVTIVGRNEPIPGSNGVVLVRDIALVGLLLAEQGLATTREHTFGNPFPFTKRLRPYLTDEQQALLESLPPVAPTIDSVIDGYIALARAFLPRAKRLAAQTNSEWPSAYEHATVAYFEHSLGVTLDL
jgi:hypothetical protein